MFIFSNYYVPLDNINIKSYYTANNMFVCYLILQTKIKLKFPFYLQPYEVHLLNFVGTHSVQCFNEEAQFVC